MAASKNKLKAGAPKRRSVSPSAPEVKLGYAPAGRDTLAAIEEDLAAPSLRRADAPVIEISEAPAGRDTLAAIAEELADGGRARQSTVPYGDRIANAPGARSPSRAPDSASAAQGVAPEAPPPAPKALEIFELLTFIVRGSSAADHSTEALRRRFVSDHLLHRVPSGSMDAVERIEITPWTAKETIVVRVWCRA